MRKQHFVILLVGIMVGLSSTLALASENSATHGQHLSVVSTPNQSTPAAAPVTTTATATANTTPSISTPTTGSAPAVATGAVTQKTGEVTQTVNVNVGSTVDSTVCGPKPASPPAKKAKSAKVTKKNVTPAIATATPDSPCPDGKCATYVWDSSSPRQPKKGEVSPRKF